MRPMTDAPATIPFKARPTAPPPRADEPDGTIVLHAPGRPPRLVRGASRNMWTIAGLPMLVEVWSAESWSRLPEEHRPRGAQAVADGGYLLISPLPHPAGPTPVAW